jgi:RecA/RadA recombinase
MTPEMDEYTIVQQDLLRYLAGAHRLHATSGTQGDHVAIDRVEMHLGHPSGVALNLGRVHALSTIRRRPPIYLLPPKSAVSLERSAALETLHQSILARGVVDLYGPDGTGKTTLATALAHQVDLNHFPDGAVFVRGPIRYPDLLQALFDLFYESDVPVKITVQNAHIYLRSLRALVILDGLGLAPQQMDPALDALQEAAVLILGPERTALGRGRSFAHQGLSHEDAMTLFAQAWGQIPSGDEATTVDELCQVLDDVPLSIASVAACAAEMDWPLAKVYSDLKGCKPWSGPGGAPSIGPVLEQLVKTLDATDREILILAGSFAGNAAPFATIARLAGLSAGRLQERIERQHRLGLLSLAPASLAETGPGTPRVALNSAYYETVRAWLVDDAARQTVVRTYASRLGQGGSLSGDELWGVLGAIEDCALNGWVEHLTLLVRAVDPVFAHLRWWAQWQHVLDLTRRAATTAGDRALEAWAMHQMGSLLAASGVFDQAAHLLGTAASIRRRLPDLAGAELSEHNLAVLEQLKPPPVPETEPPRTRVPEPSPAAEAEEPAPEPVAEPTRRRVPRLALVGVFVLLALSLMTLRYAVVSSETGEAQAPFELSWEFGDAWNALDNTTWTQQIKIVVDGEEDDYLYFVDDEPSGPNFEVTLPLCEGGQGTIRVESARGESAEVPYAFDSPYCR